jgi:hypothetical protein
MNQAKWIKKGTKSNTEASMHNPTRSRNIALIIWGSLIVLSVLTFIAGISGAQATTKRFPSAQTTTASYFGDGEYSVDATRHGKQYPERCTYTGDVGLNLFDDGTFELI